MEPFYQDDSPQDASDHQEAFIFFQFVGWILAWTFHCHPGILGRESLPKRDLFGTFHEGTRCHGGHFELELAT